MSGTAVTEEQILETARTIGEQPDSRIQRMLELSDLIRPRMVSLDLLVTGRVRFRRQRGTVETLANMVAQHGQVVHERT